MLLFNLSHCAVPFDILWIMTPHWASHNMWLFFFLGTTTSMVRTYVFFSTINGSFIHFFLCSRIFPVGGGGAQHIREKKKKRDHHDQHQGPSAHPNDRLKVPKQKQGHHSWHRYSFHNKIPRRMWYIFFVPSLLLWEASNLVHARCTYVYLLQHHTNIIGTSPIQSSLAMNMNQGEGLQVMWSWV